MNHDTANAIERLYRRVLLTIGVARINVVNDSVPNIQSAQIQLGADEIRDNTYRMAEFGFASNPPPGSDAVVVFIGGDRNNAMIVATGNQASRPHGLEPGETMIYDLQGKSIYFKADGSIVVDVKSGPVVVNNATEVTVNATTKVRLVTPLLEVTGDILDNCDTNTETVANMRTIYDEHTHGDVQNGAGNTSIPNQLM